MQKAKARKQTNQLKITYFPDIKVYRKSFDDINKINFYLKAKQLLKKPIRIKLNKEYKNIIVIGNGGSINPLLTLYNPFKNKKKNLFVLNSEDPWLIKRYSKLNKNNTLVIAISKSGETSSVVFNYLALQQYDSIVITASKNSTLAKLAKARKAKIILSDKNISGRFSGFSESSLLPLKLLNINTKEILKGSLKVDVQEAYKLAKFLYENEKKGYTTLYIPIYSVQLEPLFTMLSQLFHETFGKNKKGLTIYGGLAPETQHHSNQRFFGGRKDSQALFIYVKSNSSFMLKENQVPKIKYKGYALNKITNLDFNDLVYKEFLGTVKTAIAKKIPSASITTEVNESNIGELLMFFYFVAYFSAKLRRVNPFDQPDVELSKKESLKEIFESQN